jgi:hypothetical protein
MKMKSNNFKSTIKPKLSSKSIIPIIISIFIITLLLYLFYKNKNYIEKFSPNNPTTKNLVFTSAGDNTEFYKNWLDNNRNYDVWCVYYGKNDDNYNMYSNVVDKIWKRKGSKFQNFHHIYNNYRDLLDKYDRFFIVDDDIIMSTTDINNLFNISIKYDLWTCQPAYTPESKISWPITKYQPGNLLRYTNYTEVGTTVFSKYAIDKFMEYYDPILIGWGIDLFYIWVLGKDVEDKYAIIDSIQCINPHDNEKTTKVREHTNIENHNKEEEYWKQIQKKYNIPEDLNFKTYSTIKLKT